MSICHGGNFIIVGRTRENKLGQLGSKWDLMMKSFKRLLGLKNSFMILVSLVALEYTC